MADEQDSPGIRVPPPLIYLLPLVSGLLLDRRLHIPFLPRRRVARILGWQLVGSGVALSGPYQGGPSERCGPPRLQRVPTSLYPT